MVMQYSKQKYQEKILHELNHILRSEVSDTRVQFVSVTSVELNKDFSVAKIYWDTFNPAKRGDCKKAIDGMRGRLRTLLSQNMKLRHTPVLNFFYNSQFEDQKKIEDLISQKIDD